MALTDKLTAVADSIRAKTGKNDLLTLDEMPNEIGSISSINDIPDELFVITSMPTYFAKTTTMQNFIKYFGDKFRTENLTSLDSAFDNAGELEYIPFELNCNPSSNVKLNNCFNYCTKLKSVPKINNCRPTDFSNMFNYCVKLTELPEDFADWFDWSYIYNSTSTSAGSMNNFIRNCYRMRKLPMDFYRKANPHSSGSYTFYSGMLSGNAIIDDVLDIPIPYVDDMTSNILGGCVGSTYRLSRFTFEMPDGKPKIVRWKSQSIDFSSNVGWFYRYADPESMIIGEDTGITIQDEVKDKETYNALKNTPNWYTKSEYYARYNHDSAVETINSLPDTSTYLAEAGGTNTIKFKKVAGKNTDGGAIENLTAEEIAVATAKGWTVSLVS